MLGKRSLPLLIALCLLSAPAVFAEQEPLALKSLDLTLIPANSAVVIAVRPGEIMAAKGLAALFERGLQPEAREKLTTAGLTLQDLESLTIAVHANAVNGGAELPFTMVLRGTGPLDWPKILSTFSPDIHRFTAAGDQTDLVAGPDSLGYFEVDPQTVVLEPLRLMPTCIARLTGPKREPAWAERWQSVDCGQLTLFVHMPFVRELLAIVRPLNEPREDVGIALALATFAPLMDDTQDGCLSLQFTGKLRVRGIVLATDAKAAVLAHDTLRATVLLVRNFVKRLPSMLPREQALVAAGPLRIADRILGEVQVRVADKHVRLQLDSEINLNQALGVVAPLMK